MLLRIYQDHETLSRQAAGEILAVVKNNPAAVLCLAAGDTPRSAYGYLSGMARQEEIDFSGCTFIGLDEWVSIPPNNEGSCHFFLKHQLFDPLGINPSHVHLFNALAKDTGEECEKMDKIISAKGGIDLMLVGIGMNGHIGFNEPGVSQHLYSHVIALDAVTQSVGQKYFKEPTAIKYGITLGLQHLLDSRQAILMASGIKKADVIRKALEDGISAEMPASIMNRHPNGLTLLDKGAASLLKKTDHQGR